MENDINNTLSEQEVGIREYLTKSKGFDCVLKHRYSDFLVNEIDFNGNVVWLKTAEGDNYKEPEKIEISTEEDIDKIIDSAFAEIIKNKDDIGKLKTLCYKFVNKEINNDDKIEIEFISEKEPRRKFHENIRKYFEFLDSETTGEKEKKLCIFVDKKKSTFNKRRRTNPEKKYLHFSMLKRNLDTVYSINYIARTLHRSNKTIRFSGTKDKRGITTQKVSCFNTAMDELRNLTKMNFWDKRIELGNFVYSDEELRLGYLKGNQFSVVFRFVNIEDQELIANIEYIKENGFINYFGMQRFGVGSIPTHRVGEFVIRKQWREAIHSIMKTTVVKEAVTGAGIDFEAWLGGNELSDIETIIKNVPRFTIEYKLLSYLKNNRSAYYNAFKCLNRQLQVLYPHAYQSYVWNCSVSERIKKYGLSILIGDIVKKRDAKDDDVDIDPDAEIEGEIDVEVVENNDNIEEEISLTNLDKGKLITNFRL
jgi:tRNA pseudouridine13 synthase